MSVIPSLSLRPRQAALPFVLSYISKHSTRRVGDGWTWSFDPAVTHSRAPEDRFPKAGQRYLRLEAARGWRCRLAIITGENSAVCPQEVVEYNREGLRGRAAVIQVRDASHHLMIDRPLTLVAAVDAVLQTWGSERGRGRGQTQGVARL